MSDRELLEAAAKAAGQERSAAGDLWSNARGGLWNPLADDGDALRLAVKLRMRVNIAGAMVAVVYYTELGADGLQESFCGDASAATRRAIVRAAAAMAQEVKP